MTRLGLLSLASALALAAPAFAQPAPLLHGPLPLDPKLAVTMMAYDLPPAGEGPLTTAGQSGHRHPAAVYAYVAQGAVISRLGEGPDTRYETGQAWSETPGQAHYIVNASRTAPARVVVVYVAAETTKSLTEPLPR